MTHDYKRHGTTTLFAGMNVADGSIISTFMPTHNHQDWIRFLKLIDKQTPQDKDVHLVLDNYSAHKTPEVIFMQRKGKKRAIVEGDREKHDLTMRCALCSTIYVTEAG